MTITRRVFSKSVIGAGAVLALGPEHSIALDQPLIRRRIPSSRESIPIIGIGTNRFGVGTDKELRAPLKAALNTFHRLGGSVIDTAPGYRSSEAVLGDLMTQLGIRDELFLATKVDVEGQGESEDRMRRSFDRLNADRMDLMQVHNFIGWEDALPVMREWKEAGRIRYLGITTSRERQYGIMEKVMRQFDLDFIQINYSLANQRQSAKRIMPLAADRGIAVLVNRPFGGGGAFRVLAKTRLPAWAGDLGASSWGQFLLKYVLSHPAVTCAIPGMTKKHHVKDNLAAARGPMPSVPQRKKMERFFDSL